MIDSICGLLKSCHPTEALLYTPVGITFRVHVPISTSRVIKNEVAGKVSLYIHTQVLTNNPQVKLYGFNTEAERNLFQLLITIKGLGPSAAIKILSGGDPSEVEASIANNDVAFFNSIKGIGKKTAEKIIFDLKDKVKPSENIIIGQNDGDKVALEEAIQALRSLGYKTEDAKKAIEKAKKKSEDIKTTEDLVKFALTSG
jgi:holliday junction DNA helicase RuvA